MKTITKIAALMMAVLMLVSVLAACGDDNKSGNTTASDVVSNAVSDVTSTVESVVSTVEGATIVGKWSYNYDMKKMMEASMAASAESLTDDQKAVYEKYLAAFDGCVFNLFFEFSEDGVLTMSVDEASLKTAYDKAKVALADILVSFYAAMYGMTDEEFEAQLKESGKTVDEFKQEALDAMDTDDMAEAQTGTYKLEGDKLTIQKDGSDDSTELTISLTPTELSINSVKNSDSDEDTEDNSFISSKLLPMVFTRVA